MKILTVDSDPQLLDDLAEGFRIQWDDAVVIPARQSDAALWAFYQHHPDVVVLDMDLPDDESLGLLQEFAQTSNTWVIAASGREEETVQVAALEAGADAFVVKPLNSTALIARIRALLRRRRRISTVGTAKDLVCGDLVMNFQTHRVTVRGRPVRLTPLERKLLYHLMRNAGRIMSHQTLLHRVWSGEREARDHLKVFISRLRAKIEPKDGTRYIETERGLGYRFVGDGLHASHNPRVS